MIVRECTEGWWDKSILAGQVERPTSGEVWHGHEVRYRRSRGSRTQ